MKKLELVPPPDSYFGHWLPRWRIDNKNNREELIPITKEYKWTIIDFPDRDTPEKFSAGYYHILITGTYPLYHDGKNFVMDKVFLYGKPSSLSLKDVFRSWRNE